MQDRWAYLKTFYFFSKNTKFPLKNVGKFSQKKRKKLSAGSDNNSEFVFRFYKESMLCKSLDKLFHTPMI
jgi:hypothetical protein